MHSTTISISTPGTQLAVDSTHYTLRAKGRRIGRIPPGMIGQVMVHHGVEVSRKAMDRLGSTGVPVTFLGADGRIQARLVAPWKYDAAPRIEQARCLLDPATRLNLARRFVDAKVANSAHALRRHAGNHPHPSLNEAIRNLNRVRSLLPEAETIDQLLGHEGYAGRVYFGVFNRMLRPEWAVFNGRNRRPPLDPVNAVLSYCYGVLTNEAHTLVESIGLDPYIGYLHGTEARRPNLALDVIEPFRPVLADRLALRLINLGQLRPEHFVHEPPRPDVRIDREGRMKVIEVYSEWASECQEELGSDQPSPRRLLREEIQRLHDHCRRADLAGFEPHVQPQ